MSNSFQLTTPEQILSFISEATQAFHSLYPDRKNDVDNYFSLWKQIFNKVEYDATPCNPKNTFSWSVNYPFLPYSLYAVFNIDALRNDHEVLTQTTLNKTNIDHLITAPSHQATHQETNQNDPILICDSISGPILIDDQQRYQNAVIKNMDIPVHIIPYMSLSKQHFTNEYNYAIFLFTEEVNACLKSFDEETLMQSYIRMGNKFKL